MDVSVVIPTCHREHLVGEAIRSVLAQVGVTLEVIVVDDSGTGSARAAVESIDDPRVTFLARSQPSGRRPAMVRNEGAARARGRLIHFLDDDDVLEPGALAAMAARLGESDPADMVFGVIRPFGDDAARLRQHVGYYERARAVALRLRHGRDLAATLVFCPAILVNSACLARRSAFLACGGFDAGIPVCEDADLWSRIAFTGGFAFVDRVVVNYRTGSSSLMHDLSANDAKLSASYRIIQEKFRSRVGMFRAFLLKIQARLAWRRSL